MELFLFQLFFLPDSSPFGKRCSFRSVLGLQCVSLDSLGFALKDIVFSRSCSRTEIELLCAFHLQLFDQLYVIGDEADQHAGRPGKSEQAGDGNDGADIAPARTQIDGAVAEGGVGISAEINRVGGMHDQAEPDQRVGPHHDLSDVHGKHQEHGPAEEESGTAKMRAAKSQPEFGPLEGDEDAMQTQAVKQHEQHQDERPDADRRHRLELVRNLQQQR